VLNFRFSHLWHAVRDPAETDVLDELLEIVEHDGPRAHAPLPGTGHRPFRVERDIRMSSGSSNPRYAAESAASAILRGSAYLAAEFKFGAPAGRGVLQTDDKQ
jgi:hypothetical protein